ncbi:MAG TPA: tetratricopeptide repeat protein [Candidatus Obscuribacterales bacterium]
MNGETHMPGSPLAGRDGSQIRRTAGSSIECTGECLQAAKAVFAEASAAAQAMGCRNPDLAKRFQFLLDLAENDRHQEAEVLFEHAVALYEAVYGQEHVMVAQMLQNLSRLYERHGNHDYAQYLAGWANDMLSAQREEPVHEFFNLFGLDKPDEEFNADQQ